jgi:hypothetical protein
VADRRAPSSSSGAAGTPKVAAATENIRVN